MDCLPDLGWQLCGLCCCPSFLYYMIFVGILLIPEHWTVDFHRWLDSWWWRDYIKFRWRQFKCTSWPFTSVFVCTLQAWPMGSCAFCLTCPGFLIVVIEFISILDLFLVSVGGGWSWFLIFFFDLEVDLCLLFVACVSFFGRICFIFSWVVFDFFFFFFF